MYRKKSSDWIKHWDFELIDIICLEIALFAAHFYRHTFDSKELNEFTVRLAIILAIVDLAVLFFANSYKGIIQRDKWAELLSTIKQVSTVEILMIVYTFIDHTSFNVSRTVFLLSWGISIVLCWLVKCAWKKVLRHIIMAKKYQSSMLVISEGDKYKECVEGLMEKDYTDYHICAVAFLETQSEVQENDYELVYGMDAVYEYVRTNIVDEVYIDSYKNKNELEKMIDTFLGMGVTVHIGMKDLPKGLPNQTMAALGACETITTSVNAAEAWEMALKRLTDIVGAIVGLLITLVAIIFVGPAIYIASPGPIFFKQERVGKNGRLFYIYKFRSMYMDAEERKKELMKQNEMQGLMFKMENDPRIIGSEKGPGKGLGNFIRKTSIDELPQFWNILKGDMSLVGTRPPTKNEYEQYDLHHKIRLSAKPGLTGMWQVSGRSEITDFEEIVKLDADYIQNWSFALDVKIILKTVAVVLLRKGSK